jgi:TatD DNase family protein
MIDTHAHVHDSVFDADRTAMLERAREAGVDGIVTVGCSLDDSRRACETAERYRLSATIGIHPHEADAAPADLEGAFDALRASYGTRIVAVGEIGLDYFYDHSPRPVQREVFVRQLDYAKERDLPLVFHQRDAFEDFTEVLRAAYDPSRQRGIVHCFTGTPAQAQTFRDEFGLLLGIGGVVTFKTAAGLREAVRAVGLDGIVLETDCPYLAPVPHRGDRNEPAYIADTARAVAGVLGADLSDVIARTDANARRLFALGVAAPG